MTNHFLKAIFTISIVITAIISLSAQNFEGKIVYSLTYSSKNPQITDQQLVNMMGTRHEYYVKSKRYKSVSNGAFLQWQLYIPEENRLYSKVSSPDAALWNDGGVNADSLLSFDINKSKINVLGYKCKELILECTSGTQKYYYSAKLSMDPENYVQHKYGNWYDYLSKAKALPLKSIIENDQFIIEAVAIEIIPEILESSIFDLDENIQIQKSPY